ncbi:MAG: ferredoxin family protein [Dehalococcoidia bacterium]|nr:ferredoxin family protein [Dehalococcoidia bacterium]MCA9828884.1 ferredoxin family protein [Dehalococcoidia bacterium]
MPYVITQPCIGVKDASCVDVCPVDCIHSTDDAPQYYINPDQCIDCAACELVCPVTAIFHEASVPDEWISFVESNAQWFRDRE